MPDTLFTATYLSSGLSLAGVLLRLLALLPSPYSGKSEDVSGQVTCPRSHRKWKNTHFSKQLHLTVHYNIVNFFKKIYLF